LVRYWIPIVCRKRIVGWRIFFGGISQGLGWARGRELSMAAMFISTLSQTTISTYLTYNSGHKCVYSAMKYWRNSTRKPRSEYTVSCKVFALYWCLFFHLFFARFQIVQKWWANHVD
jgi:hypothetical protein